MQRCLNGRLLSHTVSSGLKIAGGDLCGSHPMSRDARRSLGSFRQVLSEGHPEAIEVTDDEFTSTVEGVLKAKANLHTPSSAVRIAGPRRRSARTDQPRADLPCSTVRRHSGKSGHHGTTARRTSCHRPRLQTYSGRKSRWIHTMRRPLARRGHGSSERQIDWPCVHPFEAIARRVLLGPLKMCRQRTPMPPAIRSASALAMRPGRLSHALRSSFQQLHRHSEAILAVLSDPSLRDVVIADDRLWRR